MKMAIYPGTFNPIHIAHLIIAETVRNQLRLDKILFITANIPPHRRENILPAHHRHAMVSLACEENPYLEASSIEIDRQKTSYTIETVNQVRSLYKLESRIPFIIGSDAFINLEKWKYPQQLADNVTFLVISRHPNFNLEKETAKLKLNNIEAQLIKCPFLGVSSTLIRDTISKDQSVKYLVLESVREYIAKNELFC